MKVLVVGPYQSPIVQKLVAALESRNIEVILASHDANDSSTVVDLGKCKSMLSYFSFLKINRLVKKYKPDVVHAHILNHYGLMCTFQRKPLLVALWGSDVMLAPNQGGYIKRKIFKFINWFVMKRADLLHTSGAHIAQEAMRQCRKVKEKVHTFYWGFPLKKPPMDRFNEIQSKFAKDYNLSEDGYYVFPRGIGKVYNPEVVAKIVNYLLSKGILGNQIIVLRGFAKEDDVVNFSKLVNLKSIIFINRVLNQDEMYVLYSKCKAHFSVPHSDSLGGGVIEPANFGSYPFLSDIPSYREYLLNNEGFLFRDYSEEEFYKLLKKISELNLNPVNAYNSSSYFEYSQEAVTDKILNLYHNLV